MRTHTEIFTEIYDRNIWGGSGGGSTPENTVEYRALLQKFLKEKNIKSVVDFGCGDWSFSWLVDWAGIEYRGFDCVNSVIQKNSDRFGTDKIKFRVMKNLLPPSNLLILKDVLQHWPNRDIDEFFFVYKSSFKYILISNMVGQTIDNEDIEPGQTRGLSAKFGPLKKYNPEILAVIQTTITSEVSLITNL